MKIEPIDSWPNRSAKLIILWRYIVGKVVVVMMMVGTGVVAAVVAVTGRFVAATSVLVVRQVLVSGHLCLRNNVVGRGSDGSGVGGVEIRLVSGDQWRHCVRIGAVLQSDCIVLGAKRVVHALVLRSIVAGQVLAVDIV